MNAFGFLKKLIQFNTRSHANSPELRPSGVPFSFVAVDYVDTALLGQALLAHPAEALENLKGGTLSDWLINHARKSSLGAALKELAKDDTVDDTTKIAVLGLAMDPTRLPRWQNDEITPQWIAQNPAKACAALKSGYGFWVDRLRKTDWFKTLIPSQTKMNVAGRECTFKAVPWTGVQMCTTIVTRGQWRDYVRQTGWSKSREWESTAFDQTDDHPVVNVSWDDANEFCAWASKQAGKRFRLPTDAEWSKAVGDTKYPWGDHHPPTAKEGIYSVPTARMGTAPVATCRPNALGLYDMGGNVWEWSLDASASEPGFRLLRGASWYHRQRGYLQSSRRPFAAPEERGDNYGFRMVLVVAGE